MTTNAHGTGRVRRLNLHLLENVPFGEWVTTSALAAAVGTSPQAVSVMLLHASRRGEVEKRGRRPASWRLTARGRVMVRRSVDVPEATGPLAREIRGWAVRAGMRLSDHGTLPRVVCERWNEAHPDRPVHLPGNFRPLPETDSTTGPHVSDPRRDEPVPTTRQDLRDAVRRSLSRDPDDIQDAAP